MCVKFAYHMYGFHIRRLELFVKSRGVKRTVWKRSGEIGNIWNRASVDVNLGKNEEVNFYIHLVFSCGFANAIATTKMISQDLGVLQLKC